MRCAGHELAALVKQAGHTVPFRAQVAKCALQVGGHVVEALCKLSNFIRPGVDTLR